MATAGFPGTFPGITATVSYRSIGACNKRNATALGFPGIMPGITSTIGYTTIGAVQKTEQFLYTMPVAYGSFAVTGQLVALIKGYRMALGLGSYLLNGQDVTLTLSSSSGPTDDWLRRIRRRHRR